MQMHEETMCEGRNWNKGPGGKKHVNHFIHIEWSKGLHPLLALYQLLDFYSHSIWRKCGCSMNRRGSSEAKKTIHLFSGSIPICSPPLVWHSSVQVKRLLHTHRFQFYFVFVIVFFFLSFITVNLTAPKWEDSHKKALICSTVSFWCQELQSLSMWYVRTFNDNQKSHISMSP